VRDNDRSPVFTCAVVRDGATATVTAIGEVDLSSSPELRRVLQAQLDDHAVATLVVDLAGVTFIDSSGLGVLVDVRKRLDTGAGARVLRVDGVHGSVRRVFEITGLDGVFVFG